MVVTGMVGDGYVCYGHLMGRGQDAAKHPAIEYTATARGIIQPRMSIVLKLRNPV